MITAVLPLNAALPPSDRANDLPMGYVRVWDGTGAPVCEKMPLEGLAANAARQTGDPPLVALQSVNRVVRIVNNSAAASKDGMNPDAGVNGGEEERERERERGREIQNALLYFKKIKETLTIMTTQCAIFILNLHNIKHHTTDYCTPNYIITYV